MTGWLDKVFLARGASGQALFASFTLFPSLQLVLHPSGDIASHTLGQSVRPHLLQRIAGEALTVHVILLVTLAHNRPAIATRRRMQMSERPLVSPIRGAIKVAASTSTDSLVAGQEFSIFVTAQNPFEIPLVLHSISTYLPAEFLDVEKQQRETQVEQLQGQLGEFQEVALELGIDVSSLPIPTVRRRSEWKKLIQLIIGLISPLAGLDLDIDVRRGAAMGPSIARDTSTAREMEVSLSVPFLGRISAAGIKKGIMGKEETEESKRVWKDKVEQELDRYQRAISSTRIAEEDKETLQPGNSKMRIFNVRSKKSIWFRPSTYRFNIEVEYEIDGVRNLDTIEHTINVTASLFSMILGALFGGLAGWYVAQGATVAEFDKAVLAKLCSSLLIAMISVVLLARKKDAQPLLSIEDIWGGTATGFLVTYSGGKIIEALTKSGVQSP